MSALRAALLDRARSSRDKRHLELLRESPADRLVFELRDVRDAATVLNGIEAVLRERHVWRRYGLAKAGKRSTGGVEKHRRLA